MSDREADLTTVAGLESALYPVGNPNAPTELGTYDGTFCPRCGQTRRMKLVSLFWDYRWCPQRGLPQFNPNGTDRYGPDLPAQKENGSPSMYAAICVQCDHLYTLVVHRGPDGLDLAALPATYGGLATPHTHPAVAYYLDQASRARSLGALSAAAAMYRAALDQLLYHEGFTNGMLGKKIADLKTGDPPPRWFRELDPDYLTVINALGNGAIHPNDGNHEKQKAIDRALTQAVDALFDEILYQVYERPHDERSRLAQVKDAVSLLKKPASP